MIESKGMVRKSERRMMTNEKENEAIYGCFGGSIKIQGRIDGYF